MQHGNTTELQSWLDRMEAGDESAREELIRHSCERLRRLTRKMLKRFPKLRRWEQTDDVLQNSLFRLHRSLRDVQPQSTRHFFALATTQIRRELIDLTRHHFGSMGHAANYQTDEKGEDRSAIREPLAQPTTLEEWSDFHQQVETLPDQEQEVFNLLWYEGLTQDEAASVLEVNVRTVKRRWQSARYLLYEALDGEPPN